MNGTLSQSLQEKITSIKSTLDQAKEQGLVMNEAQTEFMVIDPLLHVLGYGPLEIHKRGHDNVANNFPDYTLCPGTSNKWFLEAKKLDHPLHDGEAAQAVNYANNQGAAWAVLTNGRSWYIYNAHLPKPLIEKRVFQINDLFADANAVELLCLLSRQSWATGGLSQTWELNQAIQVIKQQLETPNSVVRKFIRNHVKREINIDVSDQVIAQALGVYSQQSSKRVVPSPAITVTNNHTPTSILMPAVVSSNGQGTKYMFSDIVANPEIATGHKPILVHFSDGTEVPVKSWAKAAQASVQYICKHFQLPALPFSGQNRGHNYFLNTVPTHENGNSMHSYLKFDMNNRTIYVDTKRSADNFAARIAALMLAVRAPQDAVTVTIL